MMISGSICIHGIVKRFAGTSLADKFLEIHGAFLSQKIDWMGMREMMFAVSKEERHATQNADDDLKRNIGPMK